jgi:hypothetical protein
LAKIKGDATMQENYEEDIKWFKKEAELHELAMQQNKDRMRALEEELHKSESDLAIAKGEAQRQFNRNLRLREALDQFATGDAEILRLSKRVKSLERVLTLISDMCKADCPECHDNKTCVHLMARRVLPCQ